MKNAIKTVIAMIIFSSVAGAADLNGDVKGILNGITGDVKAQVPQTKSAGSIESKKKILGLIETSINKYGLAGSCKVVQCGVRSADQNPSGYDRLTLLVKKSGKNSIFSIFGDESASALSTIDGVQLHELSATVVDDVVQITYAFKTYNTAVIEETDLTLGFITIKNGKTRRLDMKSYVGYGGKELKLQDALLCE